MPGIGQQAGSGAATGASAGSIIPGIGTGIGALAGGAIGLVSGLLQKHKANKLLNGLQYPTEQLPAEEQENTNLLRQQAATGLPSEQYSKAMRDIQRQQLFALQSAHDRRGGIGALAGIQQGTNDANLNLNVQDVQMRLQNQAKLIQQNSRVGGIRRDLFDKNIRDKYVRDYSYGMGLKGAGNANVIGGLDKAASGAGYIADGLFGRGGNGGNAGYNPSQQEFLGGD